MFGSGPGIAPKLGIEIAMGETGFCGHWDSTRLGGLSSFDCCCAETSDGRSVLASNRAVALRARELHIFPIPQRLGIREGCRGKIVTLIVSCNSSDLSNFPLVQT